MAVSESADGTRGTSIVDAALSTWTIQGNVMLRDGIDTHGRGSQFLYLNRIVYALGTDGNWWSYGTGGSWRYIGPDPGAGGGNAGASETAEGTSSTTVVDAAGGTWTIQSTILLRDGVDMRGRGSLYYYHNHAVYALGLDNNWWLYDAGTWRNVGPNPGSGNNNTVAATESAEGTRGVTVVDSAFATWTIQATALLRDGIDSRGRGSTYLYHNHAVYALGNDNNWWMYNAAAAAWQFIGADPLQGGAAAAESAEGTRSTTIVDSTLTTWTIQANALMRGGVDTHGRGSIYLYHNRAVYALALDGNWWVYSNGSWQYVGADPLQSNVTGTQTAVNLAPLGFYGNNDPFINRFKRASRWWHYGGVTKDQYTDQRTQWLRGIPNGEMLTNLVCVQDLGGELDFTEQRAGTHYILWQGPLTCSMFGVGVTNGRLISPGKYAFDVPPTIAVDGVPTLANPALNFQLANQSGSVQDFTPTVVNGVQYPAIIHADDEADFLAGRHFQQSFIDSLSNAKVLRTMDWNLCPLGGVAMDGTVSVDTIEPANYYDQNCRTYITSDDNRWFFPPEEIGCLAREANVSIFNSINAKSSDATFDYWGQKFAAGAGPNWYGDLWSELGDENWNTAWPWLIGYHYLHDRIAPTISVVDERGNPSSGAEDRVGCATAARSLKLWAAMERYIPRARHKRVLGGQFAAGSGRTGMGGMFAYVDPASGRQVHELADYYAVAPYWGADRDDGLTLNTILQDRLWLAGDQFWIDRCKLRIDKMQVQLAHNKQYLATFAPNLKLACYEGGGWLWGDLLPGQGSPQYAAAKEFDNYCRYFMDSDAGRIVTQYYWDTLIKGNFVVMNHFFHVGYSLGLQQGLQNSQHRRDTPRQALFSTLGG